MRVPVTTTSGSGAVPEAVAAWGESADCASAPVAPQANIAATAHATGPTRDETGEPARRSPADESLLTVVPLGCTSKSRNRAARRRRKGALGCWCGGRRGRLEAPLFYYYYIYADIYSTSVRRRGPQATEPQTPQRYQRGGRPSSRHTRTPPHSQNLTL